MTLAQAPLADFLDDPRIACQTDNLATRLLLRPHALLPEDGFVDPAHDRQLLDEAAARLATFDFADIVESPTLEERLSRFLDRPAMLPRHNETPASRHSSEPPLHASLTPRTFDLLDARCRLDRALWLGLASREASTAEAERHAARVLAVGMARHGALLGR